MTSLVLTGFRAFPGVADNPTERLVEHFRAAPHHLPDATALHLLDVEYRSVGRAIDSLLELEPRALILTGYSNLATAITLESRATGLCAPDKPDACGHVPLTLETPPETLECRADLDSLHRALEDQSIPAEISQDAGAYLCNYSYRHALERVDRHGLSTKVLFVHVPAIHDTALAKDAAATMALEDMARALSLVARRLVGDGLP